MEPKHPEKSVRVIVRSADRNAGGITNSFKVKLPLFPGYFLGTSQRYYVKLTNVVMGTYEPPIGVGYAFDDDLDHPMGFNTNGYIDMCVDFVYPRSVDTDRCKSVAGVASANGKRVSDTTFALIPTSRGVADRCVRFKEQPWVLVSSPNNFSELSVKVFSSIGVPLLLRHLVPTAGVYDEGYIDDWAFEMLICPEY